MDLHGLLWGWLHFISVILNVKLLCRGLIAGSEKNLKILSQAILCHD
jgi:hypothetical protein